MIDQLLTYKKALPTDNRGWCVSLLSDQTIGNVNKFLPFNFYFRENRYRGCRFTNENIALFDMTKEYFSPMKYDGYEAIGSSCNIMLRDFSGSVTIEISIRTFDQILKKGLFQNGIITGHWMAVKKGISMLFTLKELN